MYELIVLALLSRNPMHGYLIAKVINDIIGPYARISNGRLYPLLAKLEGEGLIAPQETAEAAGERHQRAYALTESGRRRFHQLMMDTTSNPGDYQRIFWLKVSYLEALQLHERLHLVDHYINYCQTHIFHLRGEAESLKRDAVHAGYFTPEQLEATLAVLRHSIDSWQLSADHTRQLRERILAQAEQGTPQPATKPGSSAETV
jgi:DNA-binding PadR family transcriptional regulator